jgi:ribosomal protein S20
MRILVTMPESAGDVHLMTGVVKALKKKYPFSSIYFATTEKFYSILDYIQMQLSNTPRKVLQDIIKREKDNGKSESEIKSYIRSSITNVLSPTKEFQKQSPAELKKLLDKGSLTKQQYDEKLRVEIMLDTEKDADEIIEEREKLLNILNTLIL